MVLILSWLDNEIDKMFNNGANRIFKTIFEEKNIHIKFLTYT